VTHENVTNLVCLAPGNLGIKPGTKVGQLLNISFDMGKRGPYAFAVCVIFNLTCRIVLAAWEMLGSLCNGGTLVLRGSDWWPALSEVSFHRSLSGWWKSLCQRH
jgi:hypothetical protein